MNVECVCYEYDSLNLPYLGRWMRQDIPISTHYHARIRTEFAHTYAGILHLPDAHHVCQGHISSLIYLF
jgi:hypothetical protein